MPRRTVADATSSRTAKPDPVVHGIEIELRAKE